MNFISNSEKHTLIVKLDEFGVIVESITNRCFENEVGDVMTMMKARITMK